MFIDSHAHLTSTEIGEEVHSMLARAQHAGVKAILNICTDETSLKAGLALSHQYPWIYQAAATTPHDVEREGEHFFPHVESLAKRGLLTAIGETGLDYHYEHSPKERQQHFLRKYLRLARESELPIVIHCREAFDDFFAILDQEYTLAEKGVLHCFTGTEAEAAELIARGWYLSLSGIVTFKNSEVLQKVAKQVPLDRLLIETDAPFLAPHPYRGKRNEPAFLPEIAKKVAAIKELSLEEVARATAQNTCRLFSIPQ